MVELPDEDRGERSLPVVTVQDVHLQLGQKFDGLADRLREEGVALTVVKVAVGAVALEVGLVIHEVEVDAFVVELLDAAVDAPPGEGHVEIGDVLHLLLIFLRDEAVFRQDHRHLRARSLEGDG